MNAELNAKLNAEFVEIPTKLILHIILFYKILTDIIEKNVKLKFMKKGFGHYRNSILKSFTLKNTWHKTSFEVRKKGFIEKHFFILSIFKVINHEHKNSVMPELTEKLIKQG